MSTEHKDSLYTSGFNSVPKYRKNIFLKYEGSMWLKSLKDEDGVMPYWRIHNGLYDLTKLKDKHPGGKFWIETTQGLDITEAFESSHNSDNPRLIYKKYFVKEISTQRTSPFTFKENGFYRTLRRKANPIIKEVKSGPSAELTIIQDIVFAIFLILTILGCRYHLYGLMCLAGLFLTFTINCAHNFFHQKDNFRMYMFDFSLLSSRGWRISHCLLHHIYPNTIHDLEAYYLDPFIKFSANKEKNFYHRYLSWTPINFMLFIGFPLDYIKRILLMIVCKIKFDFAILIQPLLLTVMALAAESFIHGLIFWLILHMTCNFTFIAISLTAAHHHHEAFIEGDRYINDKDWGMLQVAATTERKYVSKNLILTAILFGNHTLHHLFPTVDHSKLPHLVEPFLETCKEFGIDFEVYTEWEIMKAFFWRLANCHPNNNVAKKFKGISSETNEISKEDPKHTEISASEV